MNPFTKDIEKLLMEMEIIVSQDEISHEDNEKLEELYQEVNDRFEFLADYPWDTPEGELLFYEVQKLKKRFREVCQKFETPDDLCKSTMDSMYPEGEEYNKLIT